MHAPDPRSLTITHVSSSSIQMLITLISANYNLPPTTTSLYSVMATLDGRSAAPARLDLEISRLNQIRNVRVVGYQQAAYSPKGK